MNNKILLLLVIAMLSLTIVSNVSATEITTFSDNENNKTFQFDYFYLNNTSRDYSSYINDLNVLLFCSFDNNSCYQETANISTSCGGYSNGTYSITNNWLNIPNSFDGDWNTVMTYNSGNLTSNFIFDVNYTKPLNSYESNWIVKLQSGSYNKTIPSACWLAYADKIRLRYYMDNIGVGWKLQCHNGATWQTIDFDDLDWPNGLYEEGMYWKFNNFNCEKGNMIGSNSTGVNYSTGKFETLSANTSSLTSENIVNLTKTAVECKDRNGAIACTLAQINLSDNIYAGGGLNFDGSTGFVNTTTSTSLSSYDAVTNVTIYAEWYQTVAACTSTCGVWIWINSTSSWVKLFNAACPTTEAARVYDASSIITSKSDAANIKILINATDGTCAAPTLRVDELHAEAKMITYIDGYDIHINSTNNINTLNSYLEFWFKPSNINFYNNSQNKIIFTTKTNDIFGNSLTLSKNISNYIIFSRDGFNTSFYANNLYPDWHLFSFKWVGSNADYYIDGILVASESSSFAVSSSNLSFGYIANGTFENILISDNVTTYTPILQYLKGLYGSMPYINISTLNNISSAKINMSALPIETTQLSTTISGSEDSLYLSNATWVAGQNVSGTDLYYNYNPPPPLASGGLICTGDQPCAYYINFMQFGSGITDCQDIMIPDTTTDCSEIPISAYNVTALSMFVSANTYCWNACILRANGKPVKMYHNQIGGYDNWTLYEGVLINNSIDIGNNRYFDYNNLSTLTSEIMINMNITEFNNYIHNPSICPDKYCLVPVIFASATYRGKMFLEDLFIESAPTTIDHIFDTYVWEGTLQNYSINVSYDDPVNLAVGYLMYNGTEYLADSRTIDGNYVIFNKSITVPTNPTGVGTVNRSVQWHLIGSDFYTTKDYQQVQAVNFTNCTTGNITLNMSFYNEENITQRPAADMDITFYLYTDDPLSNTSKSFGLINNNTFSFCISPNNQTFHIQAEINYYAPNKALTYAPRTYYLIDLPIGNNTLTNVSLYMLNYTKATTFKLNLRNSQYEDLQGAYAFVQRFYFENNNYKTVEIGKTDQYGETLAHFVLEDVFYKFLIYYQGNVVYESLPMQVYCVVAPCELNFAIKSPLPQIYSPYPQLEDVVYDLHYNNITKIVSFSWLDTKGGFRTGRLEVIKGTTMKDYTMCNTSSNDVAATLTCNLTNQTGMFTANAYLTGSPEKVVSQIGIELRDLWLNLGADGLFWSMILILTLVLAGIWNPIVSVLLGIAGVIIVFIFGLAAIPITTVVAIIIIGGVLIWRLKT